MSQHDSEEARPAYDNRERRVLTALFVALLGTATCFRLMSLSSMPGISGDEGWWGVQAVAWLSDRPYEAHTTSGNPTDPFFLIPLALLHTIASPSFWVLRAIPALVNLLALPLGFWFARRLFGNTTAWIYTVALAIMPTAIAHSRLAQDPSQSIFWTSIVIYLCLLSLEERQAGLALPWRRASGLSGCSLDASDQCLHRSIPRPALCRSGSAAAAGIAPTSDRLR